MGSARPDRNSCHGVYESCGLRRGVGVRVALGDPILTVEAPAEFQTLYGDEFERQVRRAALLVGSSDVANDIVQEAFVRLYQRWDRVEDPGPYLHRSVLNGCRDHGRRQTRVRNLEERLRARPGDTPNHEILWDVLADLPFNQRAAVVLRYYAGMTEKEIAEQLDCRPGSVGPWISRGLNKMRKALR